MKFFDTWTPGARAMMNWTILSALLYRPSQKIVLHYLFLSPCTPLPWWSIHLFAGFICFSSVCLRNMGAFFQAIWGFLRRSPHTFCMLFQSAGGYRCHSTNNYSRAIPTILILAIPPIGWYSTSIATCKRHIGYIRLQQMIYVGHLSRTYTFILHTDDLVYLWRIRTWNYYHIDKECKMGFLHQQGIGDNDIR